MIPRVRLTQTWHLCRCSWATSPWAKRRSLHASCMTSSTTHTRSACGNAAHTVSNGLVVGNGLRTSRCVRAANPIKKIGECRRRRLALTSCQRPCTWKTAQCGCSSGKQGPEHLGVLVLIVAPACNGWILKTENRGWLAVKHAA